MATRRRPKRRRKALLLVSGASAALAVAAMIALDTGPAGLAFMVYALSFELFEQPWIECAVPHPGGAPRVVFMQRSAHSFLAEYDYKIRFEDGEDAVERWLPANTGGRTRMNAYWHPAEGETGPSIRLLDRRGEYLLRLDERKTYQLTGFEGRVYAGEITESAPGRSAGRRWTSDGPGEVVVKVGDERAVDVSDTAAGRDPGLYLGRIEDGRFLPAAVASEEEIAVRWFGDPILRERAPASAR